MIETTTNLNVTPLAVEKLKGIMEEQGETGSALRVIVTSGGCSGLQYMMTLEKDQKEDDQLIETNGVKVLLDSESAPLMEGSEIDYIEHLDRTGFVVNNPNAKGGGCGCGGEGGGAGCGCGGGGH